MDNLLKWIGTSSKHPSHSTSHSPWAKDSYRVIEKQFEVNINGKWQLLQQWEEILAAEGIPHTFRNSTTSITRVYNTRAPAMRFDDYFEGLSNAVEKLSNGSKSKLEMDLNVATHLSMLMKKYKEEIVSVNPRNFVVSMLDTIGKIRGLKV